MIQKILWVALGGAIGAVSRYLAGGWIHRISGVDQFPIGTFVINFLGCALIGLCAGLPTHELSDHSRTFLIVGILGGFTTFSSFGFETWVLMREGAWTLACLNAVGQVVLGLFGVGLGTYLAVRLSAT